MVSATSESAQLFAKEGLTDGNLRSPCSRDCHSRKITAERYFRETRRETTHSETTHGETTHGETTYSENTVCESAARSC